MRLIIISAIFIILGCSEGLLSREYLDYTFLALGGLLLVCGIIRLTRQVSRNHHKQGESAKHNWDETQRGASLNIIPLPALLTEEEMREGCEKLFTVNERSLPVSFPAGIRPGSKMHIKVPYGIIELTVDNIDNQSYAEPDYFIGEGISEPMKQDNDEESSWYIRGLRYMYGTDREVNYRQAVGRFVKGYETGDLNAGYMLCHCYKEGKGVPIKPSFVIRLANYLVRRRFYPAYYYLATAYREGKGVPMDPPLAAEYSAKLTELCAHPLEGVDEAIRYDALLYHEMQKDAPDSRELERLARLNFNVSTLPSRYSLLAVSLLRDVRSSATAREELRSLLDTGRHANDMGCYYLKGLLLCNGQNPIFTPDETKGIRYLYKAAEALRTPATLKSYLVHLRNKEAAQDTLEKFWQACTLGISGIRGSDDLPCSIRLIYPESSPAAHHAIDFFTQEAGDVSTGSDNPVLLLKNESDKPIENLHVRICSIEKKLDTTISTPTLAPQESRIINPAESYLEIGKRLYIEVFSGGLYSRLYLRNADTVKDFSNSPYLK